jgi:hypothetical protein
MIGHDMRLPSAIEFTYVGGPTAILGDAPHRRTRRNAPRDHGYTGTARSRGHRAAVGRRRRLRDGCQTDRVSLEPLRSDAGGDCRQLFHHRSSGGIKIVRMLIVAQEDGVDAADIAYRDRRPPRLLEGDRPRTIVARRVEGRIGEEPEARDADVTAHDQRMQLPDVAPD